VSAVIDPHALKCYKS